MMAVIIGTDSMLSNYLLDNRNHQNANNLIFNFSDPTY